MYFLQVPRVKVPIISYTNLLIANLIQMCIMIAWVARVERSICVMIHVSCAMASLYFKMCIALERYPSVYLDVYEYCFLLESIIIVRNIPFCTVIIIICFVPLAIILKEFVRLIIYALLPAPLSIFCLAWTFTALPAATSVPTEDKRRSLGTLVLLFFNYFVMILPTVIFPILDFLADIKLFCYFIPISILFLLCPFVDLILFLFMQKGCIDKLLVCLCCCSMNNTVSDVEADYHCD
uniref:G-protein coupled receptors family 1 profile domain-containing protein n=1 Tax=Neolamprologus brichardi TaxID=32507 RepID=A0A3Q4MGZ6_NEOBR